MPAFAVLYNWLVLPHHEYAMQACSPNLVADAGCLEQIQRLVTRLVKGFHRLPYEERLRRLGLHSLRRRRLCGDLKVVYKMFSAGLDLDPSLFFSASAACLERLHILLLLRRLRPFITHLPICGGLIPERRMRTNFFFSNCPNPHLLNFNLPILLILPSSLSSSQIR